MIEDFRTAIRRLARSPMFAMTTVVTLAVGIAAASAILAVVQGVLINPLSYSRAEELVGVWHSDPEHQKWQHAHISYLFYRRHTRTFDDIGLYQTGQVNLSGTDRPEQLPAVSVTPSLLDLLRIRTQLGRPFFEHDGDPQADPVVLISHGLWQRRFGGDPEVVGQMAWIDGAAHQIVGVLEAGERIARPAAHIILPMIIDESNPERGLWGNTCVARLRSGETRETAQLEMEALTKRLHEVFPDPVAAQKVFESAQIKALVTPLKEDVVGEVEGLLWILFGCAGVVLVIAVANVANLALVRAEARSQERALRSALGATRGAIARGAAAEGMIVSVAGAGAGVGLAALGLRVFLSMAPPELPRLDEIAFGPPVFVFASLVAIVCTVVFGAFPAVFATERLSGALREGGGHATGDKGGRRVRELLVIGQLAMALTLIVVAGLLVRSFRELERVDPGCDPAGVVAMHLSIPDSTYGSPRESLTYYTQVLEKVRALPGVATAGLTSGVPVESDGVLLGHSFEHRQLGEDEFVPNYMAQLVLPDAIDVLGLPLLAGRRFVEADLGGDSPAVIVSESLARLMWPDPQDAIGGRVGPGRPQNGGVWYTIVGVVGDVPYGGLVDGLTEALYYPFWSLRVGADERLFLHQLQLVIKAPNPSPSLVRHVVEAVWSVDPDVPVVRIRNMEEVLSGATARTEFVMIMLLVAAGIAIILGSVGLYGSVSYIVSLRTREIGIRIALGADPREVRLMVLRRGLAMAAIGLAVGLAGALTAGRLAAGELYGVSPADPMTLALGSCLLVLVAMLAAYFPARRAAAMHPVDALRSP